MWLRLTVLVVAQLTSFDRNATSLYADSGSSVTELTRLPTAADGVHFHVVCFYAPSCPHCQAFAPSWKRLAKRLQSNSNEPPKFRLSAINCEGSDVTQDLCIRQIIPDVPLIRAWVLPAGDGVSDELTTLTLTPEALDASVKVYGTEESAVMSWLLQSCTSCVTAAQREALQAELQQQRGAAKEHQRVDHNWNGAEQDDLVLHDAALVDGEELERQRADFNVFDINGDGAISDAELCATWRRLGRNLTMTDCATIIAAADASHSATLDLTEFLAVGASGEPGSHSGHRFPASEERVSPHERLADVTFAVNYVMHHGVFAGAQMLPRARKSALVAWLLVSPSQRISRCDLLHFVP